MLPSAAGSSATVLVAFATIGVSPAAMRAGKVSSVPPPAIELTIPASSAAPAPTRSCAAGMEVEETIDMRNSDRRREAPPEGAIIRTRGVPPWTEAPQAEQSLEPSGRAEARGARGEL